MILEEDDFHIWYDVQGCDEVTLAITPLGDDKKAKRIRKQILKNQSIINKLKKHYVGTSEHISDCSVCSFLKPIMEGKR